MLSARGVACLGLGTSFDMISILCTKSIVNNSDHSNSNSKCKTSDNENHSRYKHSGNSSNGSDDKAVESTNGSSREHRSLRSLR